MEWKESALLEIKSQMIFHGSFANNHEGRTVVASQKVLLCYTLLESYKLFQLFNKLVQLTW